MCVGGGSLITITIAIKPHQLGKVGTIHDLIQDERDNLACITGTLLKKEEVLTFPNYVPLTYSMMRQYRPGGWGCVVAVAYQDSALQLSALSGILLVEV